MKRMSLSSMSLLFMAAVIWGFAFVAQRKGMDYLDPFSFNGARYLLGSVFLAPLVFARKKKRLTEKNRTNSTNIINGKIELIGGICCGTILCIASALQQFGLKTTTVGKAGFITTLYIILVPLLGLFLKKKVSPITGIGAIISAYGMYLLCMTEKFTLSRGDALLFLCAIFFSIHIMIIDYFGPKVDGIEMSCIQFLIAGILSSIFALLTEQPTFLDFKESIIPIAYTGILSSGVAYTFQILGQRDADPTVSALIFSLEAVISVLAGWWLLGQNLTERELIGCGIVFVAVVMVQLPWERIQFRRNDST